MAGGGYDIGASFAASSSSGASHSGALGVDVRSANYGTVYGPGSLIESSGFGATAGGGLSPIMLIGGGAAILAAWYFIFGRKI